MKTKTKLIHVSQAFHTFSRHGRQFIHCAEPRFELFQVSDDDFTLLDQLDDCVLVEGSLTKIEAQFMRLFAPKESREVASNGRILPIGGEELRRTIEACGEYCPSCHTLLPKAWVKPLRQSQAAPSEPPPAQSGGAQSGEDTK